jgi:hypothetical protein
MAFVRIRERTAEENGLDAMACRIEDAKSNPAVTLVMIQCTLALCRRLRDVARELETARLCASR